MAIVADSRREVLRRLRRESGRIQAFGVRSLSLFGSFAREEQVSGSDVDLLVEFEPSGKTYENFLALAEFLETVLLRPVDLITTESLSPHFAPRILAEARNVPLAA